jgi:hypothetical protein
LRDQARRRDAQGNDHQWKRKAHVFSRLW